MLDGAGTYSILIESTSLVTYPSFVDIFGNTAVGYGLEEGFLRVKDTGGPQIAAAYLNIYGNTIQFYYRAPIVIERTRGVKLHGNSVAGINCDGVTGNDPYTLAGAVFDGNCSFCDSHGNTWGGGINDPISNDGGKGAKWGVYFEKGAQNISASNERSSGLALGGGGGVVGGLVQSYPAEYFTQI